MNAGREYFPPNGNANGNGNGHTKIFDLTPKEDPLLSKVVPAARRRVCENTKISESSRMFFCWLTDTSLIKGISSRPGVVHYSDSYLAKRFGVNRKTIQNWRNELRSTNEVWCTELRLKNCFPKTVYNIGAIVGQQMPLPLASEGAEGDLPEDSVFTSNRFRLANTKHEKGSGKFACRRHGVSGCQACRAARVYTPGAPAVPTDILKKTEENQPSEKFLPSTTAIDCRPQRQIIAAHNGKILPSPMAIDCREGRQRIAVAHGNGLPLSTANNCHGERQEIADKGEPQDVSLSHSEESFKRSTGLNALKKGGGTKKISAENAFLADVSEIMDLWRPGHGKTELANSGAWWRQSYRADADLIQRVLAETKSMITEGKIKETPGQVAVDLWKRWSLDKLRAVTKPKTAAKAAARA